MGSIFLISSGSMTDVFVLAVLVALDDLATLEDLVVRRAIELLLYPLVIGAVQHVEGDAELRAPENRRTGIEINPNVR